MVKTIDRKLKLEMDRVHGDPAEHPVLERVVLQYEFPMPEHAARAFGHQIDLCPIQTNPTAGVSIAESTWLTGVLQCSSILTGVSLFASGDADIFAVPGRIGDQHAVLEWGSVPHRILHTLEKNARFVVGVGFHRILYNELVEHALRVRGPVNREKMRPIGVAAHVGAVNRVTGLEFEPDELIGATWSAEDHDFAFVVDGGPVARRFVRPMLVSAGNPIFARIEFGDVTGIDLQDAIRLRWVNDGWTTIYGGSLSIGWELRGFEVAANEDLEEVERTISGGGL